MEIKDIKRLAAMMKDNELSEIALEDGDFKLTLKSGSDIAPVVVQQAAAPMMMADQPTMANGLAAAAPAAAPEDDGLIEIKSPMVGTFYRSPSPDADSFVSIGKEVTPDSTVCIIEAMKVMNEINAEVRGVIRKIMVEDATPIEFGQVLFKVEPA